METPSAGGNIEYSTFNAESSEEEDEDEDGNELISRRDAEKRPRTTDDGQWKATR